MFFFSRELVMVYISNEGMVDEFTCTKLTRFPLELIIIIRDIYSCSFDA